MANIEGNINGGETMTFKKTISPYDITPNENPIIMLT